MGLVGYSDSETSEDDTSKHVAGVENKITANKSHNNERPQTDSLLPPLPDSFHNLYTSASRKGNQDDPSLHSGRLRITPHIEGNWPSHVYIEWHPSKEDSTRIHDLIADAHFGQSSEQHQVHSLLRSDLGTALPLHISLSRPLNIVTHERQGFNDTLALEINRACIRPFEVLLCGLDWVSNVEKTRWFLVMRIPKPPMNELNRILKISNAVAQKFGNLPLYSELQSSFGPGPCRTLDKYAYGKYRRVSPYPKTSSRGLSSDVVTDVSSYFHVSIGWSLSRPSDEAIVSMNSKIDGEFNFRFLVNSIKVKIGNAVTALMLLSKLELSNGFIDS